MQGLQRPNAGWHKLSLQPKEPSITPDQVLEANITRLCSGEQEAAVPEDSEVSGKQLEKLGRRSSDSGRRVNGSRREMRPSMEARWRKLDISALQVTPSRLTCAFEIPVRRPTSKFCKLIG